MHIFQFQYTNLPGKIYVSYGRGICTNSYVCVSDYNAVQKLMRKTTNFNGNSDFLGIRKVLNLSLKAEIQLQKENHTEDWALGSHPRDNGHVTH